MKRLLSFAKIFMGIFSLSLKSLIFPLKSITLSAEGFEVSPSILRSFRLEVVIDDVNKSFKMILLEVIIN